MISSSQVNQYFKLSPGNRCKPALKPLILTSTFLFFLMKLAMPDTPTTLSVYPSISEGLPGVLGNKGTWPFTFREQGILGRTVEVFSGTMEHWLSTIF